MLVLNKLGLCFCNLPLYTVNLKNIWKWLIYPTWVFLSFQTTWGNSLIFKPHGHDTSLQTFPPSTFLNSWQSLFVTVLLKMQRPKLNWLLYMWHDLSQNTMKLLSGSCTCMNAVEICITYFGSSVTLWSCWAYDQLKHRLFVMWAALI